MRAFLILIFTLSHGCLFAQLSETDTLPFSWKFNATGSWIAGNVDRLLLNGGADLASVHKKWAVRSSSSYQYGTFGGFRTENDLVSKNFFYLSPRSRVYPYLMGWLERNHRRDYALRYQLGPGISWSVWRTSAHSLKISVTATWEETRFNRTTFTNPQHDGEARVSTFRGTLRLYGQHRLAENRLKVSYELWAQPSLNLNDNYRLYGDLALAIPLSRRLALRTLLNYNYERLVLTGVQRQDIFWTFGITITH